MPVLQLSSEFEQGCRTSLRSRPHFTATSPQFPDGTFVATEVCEFFASMEGNSWGIV